MEGEERREGRGSKQRGKECVAPSLQSYFDHCRQLNKRYSRSDDDDDDDADCCRDDVLMLLDVLVEILMFS